MLHKEIKNYNKMKENLRDIEDGKRCLRTFQSQF